ETSIVERAGYGWLKYSAITALTSANWPRLVRYSPTRATSSSEPPAASHTAFRLSNARRACAAMSPATSSPVAGSIGICPDRYTVSPQRTACEYGPMAAGAWSVWMGWRMAVGPGFGIRDSGFGIRDSGASSHAFHRIEPSYRTQAGSGSW